MPVVKLQPSTRYLVLACDILPLAADEICRVLRHANKLGDFYYCPGAQSLRDFVDTVDFFDHPTHSKFFGKFITHCLRSYDSIFLINPSDQFLQCKDPGHQEALRILKSKLQIINDRDDQPSALIQICVECHVFPERRQHLIAELASNYLTDKHVAFTTAERDWLLSRNYRLQGITLNQENTERAGTRRIRLTEHPKLRLRDTEQIFVYRSQSDNATVTYDTLRLLELQDLDKVYNCRNVHLIDTPNYYYALLAPCLEQQCALLDRWVRDIVYEQSRTVLAPQTLDEHLWFPGGSQFPPYMDSYNRFNYFVYRKSDVGRKQLIDAAINCLTHS